MKDEVREAMRKMKTGKATGPDGLSIELIEALEEYGIEKVTRNKINPEIAEEQCGFVEGKGTTNAIFILRTLIERALEIQKDVYLCFIDYTKAFDRVRHDEIIKELFSNKIR